jgi:outer membrane protein assembly factor BamD (BamD/ComL family)
MNNQTPNSNYQINSKHQILPPSYSIGGGIPLAKIRWYSGTNTKLIRFGKLVIGYWLLFGYWCLVIGISNAFALNLDKLKANFLSGDYKSAIIEGEKMLASESNEAGLDELYYILGLSYLKDGNYLRASDIFEIILNEFKNSKFKEEAKVGLGDTYFVRGDYEKAEGYYKELMNSNPQTKLKPQIYYRLSQVGFKKGDKEQGKDYLSKLKQKFPLSPEARINNEVPDFSSIYYTVQVGSFTKKANAENLTQKLIEQGYPAYMEEPAVQDKVSYKVKVGKLNTRQEALDLENKLIQQGYPTKICP